MLAFRIARRELRAGLSGFRIFLACLALGVAAIAGVGSLSKAFLIGLDQEGRSLLGGDIEVVIGLREASEAEREWMESTGRVSEIVSMRANAVKPDRSARRLVSLKAVDEAYPMLGSVVLDPDMTIEAALAVRDGVPGAVVERVLLERLDMALGERLRIGTSEVELRGVVVREPDTIAGGFRLGPRLMMSRGVLEDTGLLQQGSLRDHRYRILLPDGGTAGTIEAWKREARERFPDSDWQIRDRLNATPGTSNLVRQVSLFLTLVGLTALIVGGVGVGNAVRGYMERKRRVIAILKCVGARGPLIFRIYFLQVMILAGLGILIGLGVGAALPFALDAAFGDTLPIPARLSVYPDALGVAAAYGVLISIAFTVWPLARAREIPAAGLFRDIVAPTRSRPRAGYVAMTVIALAGLAVLAVLFTPNRAFSIGFLITAAAAFVVLRLMAWAISGAARAAGRPRLPALRIALANLYRPGAATNSIVLSLGLGLTLLVTVSLINNAISSQVVNRLPDGAPAFFFVDIPKTGIEEFREIVETTPGTGAINATPNLRGRIVSIKGVPADEAEVAEGGRWALRGDRGITYATQIPENSSLASGEWWPADYDGPLRLSIEQEIATEFGVSVGDTIGFNILGRNFEAEIANTRELDWETVGLNFIFVFSPGILSRAPHTWVATVVADPSAEEQLANRVGEAFPNVSTVRVREAIESLNALLADLALAVQGTSGVTLLAGVLVLAGAMAAGHRQRVYDASVLKVLGATRARIIGIYLIEYGLLGLATALLASLAGTLAAFVIVTQIMDAPWVFDFVTVALTVGVSVVVTIVLGLLGTWRSLGVPASRVLRSE